MAGSSTSSMKYCDDSVAQHVSSQHRNHHYHHHHHHEPTCNSQYQQQQQQQQLQHFYRDSDELESVHARSGGIGIGIGAGVGGGSGDDLDEIFVDEDVQRFDADSYRRRFGDKWKKLASSVRDVVQSDGTIIREYVIEDPSLLEQLSDGDDDNNNNNNNNNINDDTDSQHHHQKTNNNNSGSNHECQHHHTPRREYQRHEDDDDDNEDAHASSRFVSTNSKNNNSKDSGADQLASKYFTPVHSTTKQSPSSPSPCIHELSQKQHAEAAANYRQTTSEWNQHTSASGVTRRISSGGSASPARTRRTSRVPEAAAEEEADKEVEIIHRQSK